MCSMPLFLHHLSNFECLLFRPYGDPLSLIICLGIPNFLMRSSRNFVTMFVPTVLTCNIPKQYLEQSSMTAIILPFTRIHCRLCAIANWRVSSGNARIWLSAPCFLPCVSILLRSRLGLLYHLVGLGE